MNHTSCQAATCRLYDSEIHHFLDGRRQISCSSVLPPQKRQNYPVGCCLQVSRDRKSGPWKSKLPCTKLSFQSGAYFDTKYLFKPNQQSNCHFSGVLWPLTAEQKIRQFNCSAPCEKTLTQRKCNCFPSSSPWLILIQSVHLGASMTCELGVLGCKHFQWHVGHSTVHARWGTRVLLSHQMPTQNPQQVQPGLSQVQ